MLTSLDIHHVGLTTVWPSGSHSGDGSLCCEEDDAEEGWGSPGSWISRIMQFTTQTPLSELVKLSSLFMRKMWSWGITSRGVTQYSDFQTWIPKSAKVSCMGISNKTLSSFGSKFTSCVWILAQKECPFKQATQICQKSFWDHFYTKVTSMTSLKCPSMTPLPQNQRSVDLIPCQKTQWFELIDGRRLLFFAHVSIQKGDLSFTTTKMHDTTFRQSNWLPIWWSNRCFGTDWKIRKATTRLTGDQAIACGDPSDRSWWSFAGEGWISSTPDSAKHGWTVIQYRGWTPGEDLSCDLWPRAPGGKSRWRKQYQTYVPPTTRKISFVFVSYMYGWSGKRPMAQPQGFKIVFCFSRTCLLFLSRLGKLLLESFWAGNPKELQIRGKMRGFRGLISEARLWWSKPICLRSSLCCGDRKLGQEHKTRLDAFWA